MRLISHNEPIFVSVLGEGPFHAFFEQYRGLSISDSPVVGTPYGKGGAGSDLVYLDGVTEATASVRIANESLMAAALHVAREKINGIAAGPPAEPDPSVAEPLDWAALLEQGLVGHLRMTNAEADALFAGTVWHDDDPEARSEGLFLDLWLVDTGPPSIARAVLAPDSCDDPQRFRAVASHDEPFLVIDTARHGLVSGEFVRKTAPDRLSAAQCGFPVALRDADMFVTLAADVPREIRNGSTMVLRTDRRLGFDPTAPWELHAQVVRAHGMFQPEIGVQNATLIHATDARFFTAPVSSPPCPHGRRRC